MKQHFMMFAAYNQWANGRIYDAAAELPEEELCRDVGAVFGSMLGTLNHLLAVDRVWMKRFTGEGDAPGDTAAMLHRTLSGLRLAREAEDKRILDWLGRISDKALAGRFSYMTLTDMRTVSQGWRRRSATSSTIRPTIAARRICASPCSAGRPCRSTSCCSSAPRKVAPTPDRPLAIASVSVC